MASVDVAPKQTEAIPAAPVEKTAPLAPAFSPAEMAGFQAEDRHAGTAVAGIMVTIFVLALFGYTFICYWVFGIR